MGVEIEHKYLVTNDRYKEMAESSAEIVQGYLNRTPERTVRVRIYGSEAFITVKGKNKGDTRLEFEYPIPVEDAEQMLQMAEGKVLRKIRYRVPYEGNVWEVDEFKGAEEGRVLAEIELPNSDCDYQLPPFVGENVTGDRRYYNSTLSAG